MKQIVSQCLAVFLFLMYVRADKSKALILTGVQYILEEREHLAGTSYGVYIYACPPQSAVENDHNTSDSKSKNSLYVKRKYNSSKELENEEICVQSYKPSILRYKNHDIERHEIGYEIYYRQENFEGLVASKDFQYLEPIVMNVCEKIKNFVTPPRTESDLREETYGFIWRPILIIEFDHHRITPTKVRYNRDRGADRANQGCGDFYLDTEAFGLDKTDSFYENDNQEALFEDVDTRVNIMAVSAYAKPGCGQMYGCFVKYPIVPTKYFYTRASVLATCCNFNTIPVWEVVAQGWLSVVDEYLYAVSEALGKNLNIITGFGEVLSLPDKDHNLKKMYLNPQKSKIPVPKLIYKIIEYYLDVEDGGYKLPYFVTIIVIHNDPTVSSITPICDPVPPTLYGWEGIYNRNTQLGLTYTCSANEKTLKSLSIMNYEGKTIEPLNLHRVAVLDESRQLEYRDFRQDIADSFDSVVDKRIAKLSKRDIS